jgi:hypothetical protein
MYSRAREEMLRVASALPHIRKLLLDVREVLERLGQENLEGLDIAVMNTSCLGLQNRG